MNRYLPKKCKNPVKAIREFCIECMGGRQNDGYMQHIKDCGSPDCAVFDFRLGNNPHHKQKLTKEQRAEVYSLTSFGTGSSPRLFPQTIFFI